MNNLKALYNLDGTADELLAMSRATATGEYYLEQAIQQVSPSITVVGRPDTPRASRVDQIESGFAKQYDTEEYSKENAALAVLNMREQLLLTQAIALSTGGSIVDIGPGTGRMTLALRALRPDTPLTAVDQTEEYMQIIAAKFACSRFAPPRLLVSPAEQYVRGLKTGSTALACTMFAVLNHTTDPERTVVDIGRSLADGGVLVGSNYGSRQADVFSTAVGYDPSILVKRSYEPGNTGIYLGNSPQVLPAHFTSVAEFRAILQKSAMRLVSVVPLIPYTSFFPKTVSPNNLQTYQGFLKTQYGVAIDAGLSPNEQLLQAARLERLAESSFNPERAPYYGYIAIKDKS